MTKKRRRHTAEQIILKLDEGHRQLAAGMELDEVCRHLEIAESTWHRWLAQYGGMKANDDLAPVAAAVELHLPRWAERRLGSTIQCCTARTARR